MGGCITSEPCCKDLVVTVRNGLLCRKWENHMADQSIDEILLPNSLRQTAFQVHHSHTTASHRGVRTTLCALPSRYYWPGLTSAVYRLVACCHVCGSKKMWEKKRRAPLRVADWEYRELAVKTEMSDFLIFCQKNPFRELFTKITIKLSKDFSFSRIPA